MSGRCPLYSQKRTSLSTIVTSAMCQMHLAVMRGEVRARLKGRVLGPEWLKQIRKLTFLERESFALPGDVVKDVRRKFGTKRGQHRRS